MIMTDEEMDEQLEMMHEIHGEEEEAALLPCPFCGGNVRIEKDYDDYGVPYWTIRRTQENSSCSCKGIFIDSCYFDSKDEVDAASAKRRLISAWNTRKPMVNVVKLIESYMEEAEHYGFSCAISDLIEAVKEGVV